MRDHDKQTSSSPALGAPRLRGDGERGAELREDERVAIAPRERDGALSQPLTCARRRTTDEEPYADVPCTD
jgi:hypothetical protein